jgi:hypothetical protein
MGNTINVMLVSLSQILQLRIPTQRRLLPIYRNADIVARFDALRGPFPVAIARRERREGSDGTELVRQMAFGLVVGYRELGEGLYIVLVLMSVNAEPVPVSDRIRRSQRWCYDLYHPGDNLRLNVPRNQQYTFVYDYRPDRFLVEVGDARPLQMRGPPVLFMPAPPPRFVRRAGGAGGAAGAGGVGGAGGAGGAGEGDGGGGGPIMRPRYPSEHRRFRPY